jgi:hypothetical protein
MIMYDIRMPWISNDSASCGASLLFEQYINDIAGCTVCYMTLFVDCIMRIMSRHAHFPCNVYLYACASTS